MDPTLIIQMTFKSSLEYAVPASSGPAEAACLGWTVDSRQNSAPTRWSLLHSLYLGDVMLDWSSRPGPMSSKGPFIAFLGIISVRYFLVFVISHLF
ncbi:hypothetical protein C8R48DRAFT_768973 [Suillus tomentosus]|nr:hypothetical protein C8R48DRAFT_768973 [Suillus tomentosus]